MKNLKIALAALMLVAVLSLSSCNKETHKTEDSASTENLEGIQENSPNDIVSPETTPSEVPATTEKNKITEKNTTINSKEKTKEKTKEKSKEKTKEKVSKVNNHKDSEKK